MLGNYSSGADSAENSYSAHERGLRLAGAPAERFLAEILSHGLGGVRGTWNAEEIAERLDDPASCLRVVYSRYAFSRRGKDRKALAEMAVAAFDSALGDGADLGKISLDAVWQHYCDACESSGRKPSPDLNRGVVIGLAGLAQAIARETGLSLAGYAASAAHEGGRLEPVFFGIVELRGVGPKVAATMLRDWIYAYGVEARVAHRDTIYLQPIDRWTRLAAPYLLEEMGADGFPDWILAGKLGKAARNAGVSGIRMNMGISWLGMEASASQAPEARFLELLGRLGGD
jgi:hypothetical protein